MATPNNSISPQKSFTRGVAQQYTSSLMFDKQGQNQLASLSVASCNPAGLGRQSHPSSATQDQDEGVSQGGASFQAQQKTYAVPDIMCCSGCQVTFESRAEQVSHFKCDWHRYNLHQRLRGHAVISEEEFDQLASDSDVSSISGSDDSEDDDQEGDTKTFSVHPTAGEQALVDPESMQNVSSERKFHKVFFRNHAGELISLHRCLLHHKKSPISDAEEIVKAAMELANKTKWIVLMISSGHFAGAVFHGKEVVAHKTFHRYTVRQKSGTAQSTRDNKGNAPKSAGSHLRRYNEAALNQEVSDLMNSWSNHFSTSDFVFVRIPMSNRGIFYGGKNPVLKKDDPRIRVIPFPTRRPTFNEIRRVQQVLASVESYGKESDLGNMIPYSPPRIFVPETGELQLREPRPEKKIKSKSPKQQEKTPMQDMDVTETTEAITNTVVDDDEDGLPVEEVESVDVGLVEMAQSIDLTHLKEFESSPNPKKKNKKKKKDGSAKTNDTSEPDTMDEDRIRWQNKLFTACKTGDLNALQLVVVDIKNTSSWNAASTNTDIPASSSPDREIGTQSPVDSQQNLEEEVERMSLANSSSVNGQSLNHQNDTYKETKSETTVPMAAVPHKIPGLSNGEASNLSSSFDLLVQVLNKPIGDSGATLLHLSAKHGHSDTVTALLEEGADPAIKDKSGKTPYGLAETEVRNCMRRFMASNPEKYDYAKAQVPSPLTAEMEAERKQKNAERRKMKKKAFNEKNKEKKAQEAKTREENEEKERFLKLSDREKRALAAERRLLQQQSEQGAAKPVLSRCWQCGKDMTGQVPFEYSDYKFCTTKCLREHRAAKPSS